MLVATPKTQLITRSPAQLVQLAEAKAHLRILDPRQDSLIQQHLDAAHAQVEADTGRAMRLEIKGRQVYSYMPSGAVYLTYQPAKSVESVKYYDGDDQEQTLDPSQYRLITSDGGAGHLEIEPQSQLTLAQRGDAVQIEYTAGYATLEDAPRQAVSCVLFQVAELFGNMNEKQMANNRKRLESLKASLYIGQYR